MAPWSCSQLSNEPKAANGPGSMPDNRIRRSATTRVAALGTLVTGPRMTAGGGFGSGAVASGVAAVVEAGAGTAAASGAVSWAARRGAGLVAVTAVATKSQ